MLLLSGVQVQQDLKNLTFINVLKQDHHVFIGMPTVKVNLRH